ncbi:MAG: DNA starvation/stationary phase protection protein Dps [Actinomycetota bacterium]
MSNITPLTTVPAMDTDASSRVIELLEERLAASIDLALTLKHAHWNVVGMNFIAVHEMLDPQVDKVREQSDELAERVATLGGEPSGTPKSVVDARSWDDYAVGRASAADHLSALDDVYTGLISDHRRVAAELADLDPVSEDIFIGHLRDLELFQWFVRAHLKDASGEVAHN